MQVEENKENKEKIGKTVAAVINKIFYQGTKVSVHWGLRDAEDKHSGVYVSAFLSITQSAAEEQRQELERRGLHLDDTVNSVPSDGMTDETDKTTELVIELSEDFVNNSIKSS